MPKLLEQTRRRLLRLRISLRWAMIAVLIVGSGLGWIAARARSQAEVVAVIRQSGGNVRYDWQQRYSRLQNRIIPERSIPAWLMKSLGPDYLSDVDLVQIPDDPKMPPIDQAFAMKLGRLYRLETLKFSPRLSIDDASFARLAGLTELEEFDLPCSGLTGAGLVHLAGMRKLTMLRLGSIPLRDEHLASLSGLTKLKELS